MSHFLKFKPKTPLWSLVAMSLLLPGAALAAGKATLINTEQAMQEEGVSGPVSITLIWDDNKNIRMDYSGEAAVNGYFITRDGKTYSVSEESGQPVVMDMSVMASMIKAMANEDNDIGSLFNNMEHIKTTKNSETVAGIKGNVYQMNWTEADGSEQSEQAVLTSDPLVVEMTEAYMSAMSGMVGDDIIRAYQDAMPNKDKGILKVSDQFYVESIKKENPPASTFELPAKPMDLQNLLGELSGLSELGK